MESKMSIDTAIALLNKSRKIRSWTLSKIDRDPHNVTAYFRKPYFSLYIVTTTGLRTPTTGRTIPVVINRMLSELSKEETQC